MHLSDIDLKIKQNLKYKRSNKEQARRLNLPIQEFIDRKNRIRLLIADSKNIQSNYISDLEDRVTDSTYNMDEGTGTLKGLFSYVPLDPAEVIKMFKIDTGKWKLSTYWNKQQSSGKYLISANITQLKKGEISKDDVVSAIKNILSTSNIIPYNIPVQKSNGKSLMVYTSDKHIGAYVSDEALYQNEYSAQSFEQRMRLLYKEIVYLKDNFGVFENIYILDLGDSMDGLDAQTTRKGHTLPQNMSNKQAFETYLQAHKTFFDNLCTSEMASHFYFKAVSNDNHSGDFGYFTNRSLEEYLNVKYPELETQIIVKFMEHFYIGKHAFILTHGKDSEDMKFGLPLHLNDKTENFINYYIDQNNINSKDYKVHLIKGDLHQHTSENAAKFRYRNTLSMFGSSKWAMHNYIPQAPGVSFDIIEDHTDRVFEYVLSYSNKSPNVSK